MDPTTNPQPTTDSGTNPATAGVSPGGVSAADDAALAGVAADLTAVATAGAPLEAPVATPLVVEPTGGAVSGMPVTDSVDGVTTGPVAGVTTGPVAGAVPGAPVVGAAPIAADPTMGVATAPMEMATGVSTAVDSASTMDPVTGATNPTVGVPGTVGTATPGVTTPGTGIGLDGLPMTEPIMRPDLPPAPDPVKQELEAPMKAAGPVPGSIGSAVSVGDDGTAVDEKGQPIEDKSKFGPNSGGTTANVAFNDPATQPDANGQPGAKEAKSKKKLSFNFDLKNMNRGVLIVLIVVASMIVIGLVAVLVTRLMG